MQTGFLRNLSASSVQLVGNQLLSLFVFLLHARGLSPTDFGMLNGILAALLTAFGILSFGIDQMLVKKIAAGDNARQWLRAGLMHNGLWGLGFFLLVLAFVLFPSAIPPTVLLPLCLGKWLFFMAQPFKSAVAGQERFQRLLYMSLAANAGKVLGLLWLQQQGHFGLRQAALVFALSDAAEFISALLIYQRPPDKSAAPEALSRRYRNLLQESLPQLGTVFFAAALARFDWIYLGIARSPAELGAYSFAYKVFELAQLPLLIIAPLLLPRFTRGEGHRNLHRILSAELLLAALTVLVLFIAYEPVANILSKGRYGNSTSSTIRLLALAIPLLYYNNFLWTLHFTAGRTRFIFRLFAGTFVVNALVNILLVPHWGIDGAAGAFVIAILFQTAGYHVKAGRSIRALLPAAFRLRKATFRS